MRPSGRGSSAVPGAARGEAQGLPGAAFHPGQCGKVRRERPAGPGIVITKTECLGSRAASPADGTIHQAASRNLQNAGLAGS